MANNLLESVVHVLTEANKNLAANAAEKDYNNLKAAKEALDRCLTALETAVRTGKQEDDLHSKFADKKLNEAKAEWKKVRDSLDACTLFK